MKVKVIDVHNHLYPKEWRDFLDTRSGTPTMKRLSPTNLVFYHKGVRLATVKRAGHIEPEPRVKDIDEYGIDIQIVSLSTPSVELLPKAQGSLWAKKINDSFATMCQDFKGRFYAFATLPYQDIKESLKELERAYKDLDAKGIMMFSNIDGKPIYSGKFLPIYEAAEAYGMPILIHPGLPVTAGAMKKVQMPIPLYGFTLDTTMAVTGLIYQGILERFPRLKIIHPHLGGVFPYLVARVESTFLAHSKDDGISLQESPTEYYKRNVFIDVVSFHIPAMRCALDFVGPDHLLIGTDYAHPDGGADKVVQFVKELHLSEEDYEKVLWKNAAKLFKLDNLLSITK